MTDPRQPNSAISRIHDQGLCKANIEHWAHTKVVSARAVVRSALIPIVNMIGVLGPLNVHAIGKPFPFVIKHEITETHSG